MRYDAYLFIEQIKTKHWLEMLHAIDAALGIAERESRNGPTDDVRKFIDFLTATQRYLLSDGRERPAGIDDATLLLLKPLCEQLVAKGRFAGANAALFSNLDAWVRTR